MAALLLFHLHAGVRVAVRAFTLMLGASVAWVTLYASDPAAIVAGFSQAAFSSPPLIEDVVPLVGLALLLPAWARARLSSGLNGWLRHLPFTSTDNRRGLALALVTVQLPLILILIVLGFVAHGQNITDKWAGGTLGTRPGRRSHCQPANSTPIHGCSDGSGGSRPGSLWLRRVHGRVCHAPDWH